MAVGIAILLLAPSTLAAPPASATAPAGPATASTHVYVSNQQDNTLSGHLIEAQFNRERTPERQPHAERGRVPSAGSRYPTTSAPTSRPRCSSRAARLIC
jgi:hypothetical protein